MLLDRLERIQRGSRTCLCLPRHITQHTHPGLILNDKLKLVLETSSGSPVALLGQICQLNGPQCPRAWCVNGSQCPWGMVCARGSLALGLGALEGVLLTREGHASFPGPWAGLLGQYKHQKTAFWGTWVA